MQQPGSAAPDSPTGSADPPAAVLHGAASGAVEVERGLQYAEAGGHPLFLDVYRAAAPDAPVTVYVHGGGWVRGSRADGADTRLVPVAERGVTVAAIDYRLADAATFPAQVHDVKGAIRWLRSHAGELGLATDALGIWGASAGAYLGSLTALSPGERELEGDVGGNLDQSSAVHAVVHWFGPADLVTSAARSGPEAHLLSFAFEAALLGADDRPDLLARARGTSLLSRVDAGAPPFLIAHGDRDRIVSPSESQALHHALAHAGAYSRLELLGDAGHEDPQFDAGPSLAMTAAWLRETLA